MDPGPQPHGANIYARTLRILHLLRMQKMTYDFLQMGINPETAGILIVHMVQVLYQTVSTCQDKPDKMREIKEAFDTMGLPFILNHIDVENILRMKPGAAKGVQSGGSPRRMTPAQFMSFMGIKPNKSSPLFRKMSRPTKKRGGARGDPGDCGGECDGTPNSCQNANCLKCVKGVCQAKNRSRNSSPVEDVLSTSHPDGVLGLVVRQDHSNPEVLSLALRSNTANDLMRIIRETKGSENQNRTTLVEHFCNTTTISLNSASHQKDRVEERLSLLKKELSEMVNAKSKADDAEFNALLSRLEKELNSLVRKERTAGAVGAVAGVAAVKLCARLLDKTASGLYTFIYWILLAGQSVLRYVPLVSQVVSGTFDTQCFGSPLPSPFDGAIFPRLVQTNNTATTYDYTWYNHIRGTEKYLGQSDCPPDGWIGYKVGDCVAKNGFELITTCTTAGIQFFNSGVDVDVTILTMILGSVIGALFFYLTYRICTLQTPVFQLATLGNKKRRRGTDWLGPLRLPGNMLKDTLKVSFWATLAGAYVDAMFNSTDRQQLKANVDNEEVTYGDVEHPINRSEFHRQKDEHFKKSIEYTLKIDAIANAEKSLQEIQELLIQLLHNSHTHQIEIMEKLIEYKKVECNDTALARFLPLIMNGSVESDQQLQQLQLQQLQPQQQQPQQQQQYQPQQLLLQNGRRSSSQSASSPSSIPSSISLPEPPPCPSSSHSSNSPPSSPSSKFTSAAQIAAKLFDHNHKGSSSSSKGTLTKTTTTIKQKTKKEGGRRKRGTRQSIRRRILSRRRK